MHLKQDTLLQGGKYRIEKVLGQGGFGITYLATQDLLDRKVAIKEFFFKEYCEREGNTNTITLGTQSIKATVERFLKKFIKEAKTISSLHHPNIIQIHDIFRENNTAYYVMEFIDGVSLGEMVKTKGALPESVAVEYIKKTADALSYIHERNINHLDVKPNNIMLRNSDGEIVLVDFGVAKQYDETTKEGTTTTPVGISHGYSPSEQYKRNGVSSFSPESDIYSLGATLYKLVTGITPPEAIEVAQDGLPIMQSSISDACQAVIKKSMMLNKTDRPRNIAEFVEILTSQIKEPEIKVEVNKEETVIPSITQNLEKPQISVVETKKNERISHNSSNESSLRNEQEAKSNKTNTCEKNIIEKRIEYRYVFGGILLIVAVLVVCLNNNNGIVNSFIQNEKSAVSLMSTKTFTVNGVSFKMMPVEGGSFTMGATPEMTDPNIYEKPTHQVTLSSYYIGETEVTQALWHSVMGNNPSDFKGDQNPVECVSWNDCNAFIEKLNQATGKNFRLPTEAEWEFAARGGNKSKHTKYSGSNNIDEVAWWYGSDCNSTQPVKKKKGNELGIYDMSGNVLEWCQDWKDKYSSIEQTNPTGPQNGTRRVFRGGCWSGADECCRTSYRDNYDYDLTGTPDEIFVGLGLRLALSD